MVRKKILVEFVVDAAEELSEFIYLRRDRVGEPFYLLFFSPHDNKEGRCAFVFGYNLIKFLCLRIIRG